MICLARPFEEIFTTTEMPFDEPLYAQLAPSEPCANMRRDDYGVKNDEIKRWAAGLHTLFKKKHEVISRIICH